MRYPKRISCRVLSDNFNKLKQATGDISSKMINKINNLFQPRGGVEKGPNVIRSAGLADKLKAQGDVHTLPAPTEYTKDA